MILCLFRLLLHLWLLRVWVDQIYELVSGDAENMDRSGVNFVRDLEVEVIASDTVNGSCHTMRFVCRLMEMEMVRQRILGRYIVFGGWYWFG